MIRSKQPQNSSYERITVFNDKDQVCFHGELLTVICNSNNNPVGIVKDGAGNLTFHPIKNIKCKDTSGK